VKGKWKSAQVELYEVEKKQGGYWYCHLTSIIDTFRVGGTWLQYHLPLCHFGTVYLKNRQLQIQLREKAPGNIFPRGFFFVDLEFLHGKSQRAGPQPTAKLSSLHNLRVLQYSSL
jgi:hypothetical protein